MQVDVTQAVCLALDFGNTHTHGHTHTHNINTANHIPAMETDKLLRDMEELRARLLRKLGMQACEGVAGQAVNCTPHTLPLNSFLTRVI